jgi:excisionase family DNA binding protein
MKNLRCQDFLEDFLTIDEKTFLCYTIGMEENRMLTVTEAATRIGVTPAAIRQAIERKTLRAVKRGPLWFIRPDDIDAFYARTGGRKGRPRRQPEEEKP